AVGAGVAGVLGRDQAGDLDEVVGEHAEAAPGAGAGGAVQQAAVPTVLAFQAGDAAFAAGAPFHQAAERPAVFLVAAGLVGLALVGGRDGGHAEGGQGVLDVGFVVGAGRGCPRRGGGGVVGGHAA